MTVFPELCGDSVSYPDVAAVIPLEYGTQQKVMATEFENGSESRRLVWQSRRRNVVVNYILNKYQNSAGEPDLGEVIGWWRTFYDDVEGPLRPFVFYFPTAEVFVKEFCGTIMNDDTTTIYLPSKDAELGSFTLYQNGLALQPGSDYIFEKSGGVENGDDSALLASELAVTGDKFYWSFKGRLKIWARLADEIRHVLHPTLYNTFSVELVPLEPTLESTPI